MDLTFATVAYADVFDYPLTQEELNRWMIRSTSRPIPTNKVDRAAGYYFLKGRKALVAIRQKREAFQKEKWEIARRAARYLARIPTIQLVGVTGGLAMNNAKRDDDIDLFLIVSEGTLWISRLFVTIYMDFFGLRRHPRDVTVTNKVCLNMFVTERGMGVSTSERDIFSAHEVLQMQPLFDRGDTYKRFLKVNTWVRTYLPNAWRYKQNI